MQSSIIGASIIGAYWQSNSSLTLALFAWAPPTILRAQEIACVGPLADRVLPCCQLVRQSRAGLCFLHQTFVARTFEF